MGKDQELIDACRTGNLLAAEKLLSSKLAAKGKGPKGAGASGGGVGAFSLIKSISSLKGANVNCSDNSGDTPLHLAALNGHLDIVLLLLDCDANPTILDTQDCSPLHLAAWNGHTEICSQLLSVEGQPLLNLQTRDGNTALHFAAHHGHINVLSLLLQKGGDPVIRNLEDKSPLDLAAQYDRLDIVTQLVTSHPELVAQRSVQNTPLHLASRLGHRAVVRYLLDSGFPIDAKTDKGTALHEAANFCKLDVIRLLLERGIDISVKSRTGCTAEDILHSIPSKAAEEALNILKTHIYHQRTPDSDGEKSIAGDVAPETLPPGPSNTTSSLAPALTPSVVASSLVEPKTNLYKSLPLSNQGTSVPPPIPPRHSVRMPDRTNASSDFAGLAPLIVPYSSEANALSLRDSGDSDKFGQNAALRDISPSSKSPTDQPKKPPRKKPHSFRRNEQGPPLVTQLDATANGIHCNTSRGKNYVNLDPEVERALVEAKLHAQPQATPATVISSTQDNDGTKPQGEASDTKPEEEEKAHPRRESGAEMGRLSTGSGDGCSGDQAVPDVTVTREERAESNVAEVSSSPPTSLDITPTSRTSAVRQDASPPTPSRRHQPPTPDCPPPSPSTALLNIQRQILPTENRRSKDMETITDSSITGKQEPEEQAVHSEQAATLPRPAQKKKPTPLPRKSSLSSDTRDLPMSSTAQFLPVSREGYSGGRPMSCTIPGRVAEGLEQTAHQQGKPGRSEARNVPASAVSASNAGDSSEAAEHHVAKGDQSGQDQTSQEFEDEPVQMRRSSSGDANPGSWDDHVFAGLLRGSVVGTPRDVSHQFGGSNVSAAALRSKKRKSTRSAALALVMEEDKDLDPEKLLNDIDKINLDKRQDGGQTEADDAVFDDFSDDWDQISATFEEFGVGLSRESVFMREHEDNFAKFLTQGKKGDKKIQSVGSWLADIGLAQYENTLVANGFDDTDFLGGAILEDADLKHIGVNSVDHRRAILEAAGKLPAVQSIDPDNPPATVAEWLGSLRLDYYFDTFMSHKFDSMNRVIQLWELELVTVLDITSVGHRKRILASLGERRPDPNISPARIRVPSFGEPTKSPFDHVDLYRDYTGARSRVNDAGNGTDVGQGSLLEYDSSSNGSVSEGRGIRDDALHLRAPHLMHETGSIKQWRHKPEILIKGCCNYTAHYLGSTLVKELKGAMSTQEGIAKLKKSSAVISKIPTIMLSISFKGVKFIDAVSKKVVCDHEIANIFCACQDGEHMNFFAYITKDKQAGLHYCHVFSVRSRELAGEIILTLGEAFEIAYQMALKEKAEQEAERFDKGLCTSDGDDATSVSSKASTNTV